MYRRQIASLDNVLDHLEFNVLSPLTAAPEVPLMRSLFHLRFKRYLAGRGHPRWFRDHGLVTSDAEMERAAASPFFRAQLLLLTALESSLLPVRDDWKIKVRVLSHSGNILASDTSMPVHDFLPPSVVTPGWFPPFSRHNHTHIYFRLLPSRRPRLFSSIPAVGVSMCASMESYSI